MLRLMAILMMTAVLGVAQEPAFEVASVRPTQHQAGPDYNNQIVYSPAAFSARSTTLKRLIAEAWRLQLSQVIGPDWLSKNEYDVICFFTPSGVKSLFDNLPKYKQNGTVIGAFGNNTSKAVEEAGLTLEIKAPQPQAPSMVAALEQYLSLNKKKK